MTGRTTYDVNAFDAKKLDKLTDDEFRALCDADLRRKAPKSTVILRKQLSDALREPQNVERWFSVLVRMAKSVDLQLAARHQDYRGKLAELQCELERLTARQAAGEPILDPDTNEPLSATRGAEVVTSKRMRMHNLTAEYAKTRASTLRFKTGLEDGLLEARFARDQLRSALYNSAIVAERNHYAFRATTLERAIREHRDVVEASDADDGTTEVADQQLWTALDTSAA
jgi:hypothetical protein